MTLYELTGSLLALQDLLEAGEYTEEELADTIESVDLVFEDKAEGYAQVMRNMRAQADACDAEIKRLQAKKSAALNGERRLKEKLEEAMRATGKLKFKTDLFSFSIRRNAPRLVVDNAQRVPTRFIVEQEPKIDTVALKEAVKANADLFEGVAHLEQGETLSIR